MAKALLGHVGVGPDLRLVDQASRLRRRVAELEGEVARLRSDNDRLAAALFDSDSERLSSDMMRLAEREPALT